ncbi:Conserved_hypothetical protein [Hexamita inflata]|uniref:Uncharacterized protein n=1 Tax=Hexamita inflata TaxID=28002 RepID=A0AA86TRT5_9EUKA|nr:Conserved hypothetical protein [Hexamita inflata]
MLYILRVQQQLVFEISYQQMITNLYVQKPIQQLCNNKISLNNIKILYCQKQALLSNNQVSWQFISQKYHSYFCLYTEKMMDVIVNFQVLPLDLPSFYLFGTTENILIQNSKINVKISNLLTESALICFKCELHAIQSSFVFVGVGTNISGLVLYSKSYITLESCSVQSRLSGKMIGGLVMQSNKIRLNLKDCNLTSYFDSNGSVGALILFVTDTNQIQSSNVKICTNMVENFGSGESFVTICGGITQNCQICGNMKYSYGICINSLDNSEIIDYKLVCKPIFVFDGEACSCQDGKVLNGSSCINILEATSHLLNQFESFYLSLRQIDAKLFDRISVLKQSATSQINQVSSSIPNFNARIDIQLGVSADVYQRYLALNEAIQQFVLKIQCGRQYCYAFQNNKCQYMECPISGQYSINGVCQCPILNMIIIGNACACPVNSSLINNECACTITGQIVKNGACQCEVIDAIVTGSTCVCPASSSVIGHACVCSVIGQIIITGICTCTTSGAFVFNGACSCGIDGLNVSNVCSCPTYSSLIGNACICSEIIGISMINGLCQCPLGYSIVNSICQYTIENSGFGIKCSLSIYVTTFDIQAITHQIINNANYSSGYVFKTATIITNAFIDISSYAYTTTIKPLFQSQASFTNIKVQIGTQTVNSGSILTLATTIVITQMNIISKLNTQITVNSLQQLQILLNDTTSTNINDLLVNLNFAPSQGNITLINASTGFMNITGYQVFGKYQSTQCVAMTAFNITAQSISLIQINNVSFQPSSYNVGRYSSYLFCTVGVCNISFNNISVILGSVTQFQILASISSARNQQYQFGGFISDLNANNNITVTNILFNCYQTINTDYVQKTGFILGAKWSYANLNVTIQYMCIQQNLSSTNIEFEDTGLINRCEGFMLIQQSSIIFTLKNSYLPWGNFGCIGVVSQQYGKSAKLINLLVNMNTIFVDKSVSIGFFGSIGVETFDIQNSSFKNYNLTTQSSAGVLCAVSGVKYFSVINTSVQTCNISVKTCAGGFFSQALNNYNGFIQNSTAQNINISSKTIYANYIGVIIGRMGSEIDMTLCFENLSILNNNISGEDAVVGSAVVAQILCNQKGTLNVSFTDFLLTNNNISGNMFTSGIVAVYSPICNAQILLLQNLNILGFNNKCTNGGCGGLVGSFGHIDTQSASLTVKNTTIQNIVISGSYQVAGFLAFSQKCIKFTTLQIYNSTVTSIVLNGKSCGMIIGISNGTSTFDIQTSKTTGNNFVNSTQIQNCASITSGISQSGC